MKKKDLAIKMANNYQTFDSDFQYAEDLEFLEELKKAYEGMEEYEICILIDSRIQIYTAKGHADNFLSDLNNQINLYKEIKRRK